MKKLLSIVLALALSVTTVLGCGITAKAEDESGPSIIEKTTVNVNYNRLAAEGMTIGNTIPETYDVTFVTVASTEPSVYLEYNKLMLKVTPEHVAKGYISQDDYNWIQEDDYGWADCSDLPSDYVMNATDTYGVYCLAVCRSSDWVFSENLGEDIRASVITTTAGATIEKAISSPHMADDPMCARVYINLGTGAQLNARLHPGAEQPDVPGSGEAGSHKHELKLVEAKGATCSANGNVRYYFCSGCDKYFFDSNAANEMTKDESVIKATGHNYGSFKTTTKATFGKAGVQTATCTKCTATTTKAIPAVKTPTLSTTTYTYNNKTKKPSVTVKDTAGNKVDCSVKYASGRKNVGKYAVTVTLTGENYSGTKTIYFTVNPKDSSVSKVSAAKKAFTVKWKKPSSTYRKQMTGYQIRYSTSSKMKSAKTVTVKSTTATSKKISKLKAKKTYYVQLRTYKKVGSKTYYSGWSKSKKIKTK